MNRLFGEAMDMMGMKKRRSNRGLMLSLVGLGLGAAAFSMMRSRNMNMNMDNMMAPVKEVIGDMDFRNPIG